MGAIRSGDSKIKLMFEDTKIKRAYAGDVKIYSAGNIVTYHVDTGITYQEEVEDGASCLSPKTFTPAKSGWTFAGWRQGTAANGSVLNSLTMGDAPITLYAVFRQTVTLTYNGNSATSGSTAAQTGYRYYNNGNVTNPAFTLRANGFSRTGYTFSKWALGSTGGTQYTAGASVTLAANATMHAVWTAQDFILTLDTSGWTQIITQGEFTSGPTLTVSGSTITVGGRGNGSGGSTEYCTGGFYKNITTRGKTKVDITLGAGTNKGRVMIGTASVTILPTDTDKQTLTITAAATQRLQIEVSNFGDTYNYHTITVVSLYFHD